MVSAEAVASLTSLHRSVCQSQESLAEWGFLALAASIVLIAAIYYNYCQARRQEAERKLAQ